MPVGKPFEIAGLLAMPAVTEQFPYRGVLSVVQVGGRPPAFDQRGRVEGDVYVSYAVINGEVIGNVYASEKLELSSKARISGNVEYNLLEMASGAEINGTMLHVVKARKLPENPMDDSQDNIHHLDDSAAVKS